jgi:putative hydrolase of the HAD superfamily
MHHEFARIIAARVSKPKNFLGIKFFFYGEILNDKRHALKFSEHNLQGVKSILFDLDDTLIDANAAYNRALNAVGIDPEGLEFSNARFIVKKRLANHTSARNRLLYFKTLLEQDTRVRNGAAAILDLMNRYEEALCTQLETQWRELSVVRVPFLRKLAEHFRLGIVTNENTRTQLLKLRTIDPNGELFSTVVISEEVGVEKPDPKIFEYACQRMKTLPHETLMIGDNYSTDVEGALHAGLKAFWAITHLDISNTNEGQAYTNTLAVPIFDEFIF